MVTKKLKSFDQNLIDLLKDAHKWEYTEINDNKEKSLQKKPKLFFTRFQWVLVLLSVGCTILCPNGLSSSFAGYVISGMSLFVGLLFTLVVSLFDKFNDTDFEKYKRANNADLYPFGVRLKNFFKRSIILTLYTAIIAIVCILMLALILMSDKMNTTIDVFNAVQYYNNYGIMFCIKAIFLLVYRSVLFYLLLNFIYITKQMITSFYDYMVSEIDKIHLS